MTNQDFSGVGRSILRKPLAETQSLAAPSAGRRVADAAKGRPEPRDILNSISAVVYDWDLLTDRVAWGANVGEVLGDFAQTMLESGDAFADLVAPQSELTRFQAILHNGRVASEEGAPYRAQYHLMKESGGTAAVEDFGRWFADASGRPARAHGVVRLIADRSDKDASRAASPRDQLTGALGRNRLIEHINEQFSAPKRGQAQFAVLIIGIDQLAALNQRYGYDIADEAIVNLASRLRDCVRATDVLARYVGGKFAIVLDNCDEEQFGLLSRRILQSVSSKPIHVCDRDVVISLRIGAALAPKHGRSAQALLQRAEEAYEFACRSRSGRVALFTATLASRSAEARTTSISDEIAAALNDRRIVAAYQPVVPARRGKHRYYEALARIRDGSGILAGPTAILPIAEKTGLIAQVDQRMLELALKRLVAEPDLIVAVNASPTTMFEPEWIERFSATLAAHPGAVDRLILEAPESVTLGDLEKTSQLLGQVKDLGVRIAIDDFGAGHTSFRSLRSLGVDIVKIDGAFIQNIARSADDRFFVRTLVDLARHLKVETVAEWVEDAEAARILSEWGVDYLQGHHLGLAETHDEPQAEPAPVVSVAFG
ncbi:MAG TPA: bifunctional diguanylate cyclase/phosphodiesterase [Roseiarcus sp.]|nr:bifunctional diguanylate cyclase/phosphodiesterase [Roseiarcus sp.]